MKLHAMTEPLSMDQAFIKKLTDIVLANLVNDNFGVGELAREAGMTRVALYRKLRSIEHEDVTRFIRKIRLHRAMEMLQNNIGTVSEIAFRVGFGSSAYFNTCFHEYYGITPGEVKKRESGISNLSQIENVSRKSDARFPIEAISGSYFRRSPVLTKILIAFIAILTVTVLVWLFYISFLKSPEDKMGAGSQDSVKSIVVLPFKNLSDDPENKYFADGMMEDIMNNLYRIRELRVISRTTAEQIIQSTLTTPEIAAKLKINFVLEGSVQKQADKIRINVQLIDALHDQHLWSGKYERDMTDIFAVQSDIAFQIADNLKTTLSSEEFEQIGKGPTRSIEAYNFYLYGRYFLHKDPHEEILKKSMEYFEKSIKADPDFALAYAGMARAYMYLAHYGFIPWTDGRTKTRELAMEALKIDKDIAEAHCVLGNLARYEFKWEEAKKEFLLAINYEPDNPTAHDGYSMILSATGKLDEARKQITIARELDPLSLEVLETSAILYLNVGKIDEMGDELRKMHEIDPGNNHAYRLYHNYYLLKGDTLNAIRSLKKSCETDPSYKNPGNELMNINTNPDYKTALEFMLEAEPGNKNPIYNAAFCIILNRKEEALTWLEKAFKEQHSMLYNIYYAWPFKSLRSEPRFQAIIKKMGLSEYISSPPPDSR